MVLSTAAPTAAPTREFIPEFPTAPHAAILSLEAWMLATPAASEWVAGQLVEKQGMTLKHGRIQARLGRAWAEYKDGQNLGGEVYTDVPCRTIQQGRRPDVAYLPPALQAQYGNVSALPQSFPLIAEIVSPTDIVEDVILKAQEYLQSGALEVWLIYPESCWVIVVTSNMQQIFTAGQAVTTQQVLPGFTLSIDELVA
jgi:Uma2 family endonuclease